MGRSLVYAIHTSYKGLLEQPWLKSAVNAWHTQVDSPNQVGAGWLKAILSEQVKGYNLLTASDEAAPATGTQPANEALHLPPESVVEWRQVSFIV